MKRNKKTRSNMRDMKQRSLITQVNQRSPISEQYRTIRTNIKFSAVDQQLQTLMVTSSGPAEGKSTTVANLAVVFSQQGDKVLLIDADLRKPTAHYTFQLNNTMGLSNVLTGQASLQDAVQESHIKNLDLLTSGPIPPNPAELLGSKQMASFMEELKQVYDIILFDTPPVLAVTDAQILANQCDGVILVTNSGKTEIEAAQKTKELLLQANAKLLGAVLNDKSQKQGNYYYYYGQR